MSSDPAMGEYVTADRDNAPGMGGVYNSRNLQTYHYAGNNPIKYVDPTGEFMEIINQYDPYGSFFKSLRWQWYNEYGDTSKITPKARTPIWERDFGLGIKIDLNDLGFRIHKLIGLNLSFAKEGGSLNAEIGVIGASFGYNDTDGVFATGSISSSQISGEATISVKNGLDLGLNVDTEVVLIQIGPLKLYANVDQLTTEMYNVIKEEGEIIITDLILSDGGSAK